MTNSRLFDIHTQEFKALQEKAMAFEKVAVSHIIRLDDEGTHGLINDMSHI